MVRAHIQEVDHGGITATLARLFGCCVWGGVEDDARERVASQCLYCAYSCTRGLVPRSSAATVRGAKVGGVVHVDFLFLGESEARIGPDELDRLIYVSVMLEDVGGYRWLATAKACTAEIIVKRLVAWCAASGAPGVWISDIGKQFTNHIVRQALCALQVQHRLSVTNPAWTSGTEEWMMLEVCIRGHPEREGTPAIRVDTAPMAFGSAMNLGELHPESRCTSQQRAPTLKRKKVVKVQAVFAMSFIALQL